MKLMIDIPEDSYERVMNPDKFYRDIDGEKIRWAVYKGIPIPDNATNGEVIKAIFPQVIIPNEDRATIHCYIENQVTEFTSMSMKEWWDAPYQKGGKE